MNDMDKDQREDYYRQLIEDGVSVFGFHIQSFYFEHELYESKKVVARIEHTNECMPLFRLSKNTELDSNPWVAEAAFTKTTVGGTVYEATKAYLKDRRRKCLEKLDKYRSKKEAIDESLDEFEA